MAIVSDCDRVFGSLYNSRYILQMGTIDCDFSFSIHSKCYGRQAN